MKINFLGRCVILIMLAIFMTGIFAGCDNNSNNNLQNTPNATEYIPPEHTPPAPLTPQPDINDNGDLINYSISSTISSNMVVQRNTYFNVFGWSQNIGGVIYGEFMGEKRYAVIDEKGEWCITFSSHEATVEAQTLKIYPKNGTVTEFTDILIGDVWIVSGQSNAELTFDKTIHKNPDYKKEIRKDDLIRIFTQTRTDVLNIQDKVDLTKPQDNVANIKRKWLKTSTSTVYQFSALGYYFAKELSKTVTDVPIGIIMSAAGGAVLHELMPKNIAEECGFTSAPTVPVSGFYNTLLHPFTKNAITGMIFYQGESEAGGEQYKVYARNLQKTVEEYRKIWNYDFPFINVQLATHLQDSFKLWPELPDIRAEQFNAYSNIKNSYIVTAMDQAFQIGDGDWAHPAYKLELGRRAASIAASVVYKKTDTNYAFCPEPDNITWNDTSVVIDFKYVGDGLKLLQGDMLNGFIVFDELGPIKCSAELIDSDTVRLSSDFTIVGIGYGLEQDASPSKANLANSIGYPLPAFKIFK